MRFEWDEGKRVRNLDKHGVDLAAIRRMDLATVSATVDTRRDCGERRLIMYGRIGGRLHAAVATKRPDALRVISPRKANVREERLHE